MKTNAFLFLIFGVLVYLVIRANRQLATTQAAIQADNQLVAIEPGQSTTIIQTVAPETPVDYVTAYNQA